MNKSSGDTARSDALVLSGVTGDLVNRKVFPALYAMARRGALHVPAVGGGPAEAHALIAADGRWCNPVSRI